MWNACLFIAGSKFPLILSFKPKKVERLTVLTHEYKSWQNATVHFKNKKSVTLKKARSHPNTSESKEVTVREHQFSTLVLKNLPLSFYKQLHCRVNVPSSHIRTQRKSTARQSKIRMLITSGP